MKITWQKITTFQQLSVLQKPWDLLNQRANDNCLFTSPAWLLNWYDIFWQENWKLHCFAAFENDNLIALFPFYYQKNKTLLSQRKLFLLGQGEPEKSEVASEYLDILIDKTMEASEIENGLLRLQLNKFDLFTARAIKHNAHIIQLLGGDKTLIGYQYCLDKAQWSIANLSKNNRSRYKRSKNQLKKINAEFSWVSADESSGYWEVMKNFHQQRWQKKTKRGAFCESNFNHFHQNLFNKKKHSTLKVKISQLTVEGQIIAINYYLLSNDTLHFYQSGWDEIEYSQLSPGFALHLWSIENSSENKYDFMLGGINDSYKAKFRTSKDPLYNIEINSKPIKSLFLKVLQKLTSN
jgi:hypothetical protein